MKATYTRYDELLEDFQRFDAESPEVWDEFVRFTNEAIKRGFRHFGSKAVFERIRWETAVPNTQGEVDFKLSNNFHAFYARKFNDEYPEQKNFFVLKDQISKNQPPKKGVDPLW